MSNLLPIPYAPTARQLRRRCKRIGFRLKCRFGAKDCRFPRKDEVDEHIVRRSSADVTRANFQLKGSGAICGAVPLRDHVCDVVKFATGAEETYAYVRLFR